MLAAVLRVADQPLIHRVNNPVERLQRDLPDEYGEFVGNLVNIHAAIATLDRQLRRSIDVESGQAVDRSRGSRSNRHQAELRNQSLRHHQASRAGIDQGVVHFHGPHLIRVQRALMNLEQVLEVFDLGPNDNLTHRIRLHDRTPISVYTARSRAALVSAWMRPLVARSPRVWPKSAA